MQEVTSFGWDAAHAGAAAANQYCELIEGSRAYKASQTAEIQSFYEECIRRRLRGAYWLLEQCWFCDGPASKAKPHQLVFATRGHITRMTGNYGLAGWLCEQHASADGPPRVPKDPWLGLLQRKWRQARRKGTEPDFNPMDPTLYINR